MLSLLPGIFNWQRAKGQSGKIANTQNGKLEVIKYIQSIRIRSVIKNEIISDALCICYAGTYFIKEKNNVSNFMSNGTLQLYITILSQLGALINHTFKKLHGLI